MEAEACTFRQSKLVGTWKSDWRHATLSGMRSKCIDWPLQIKSQKSLYVASTLTVSIIAYWQDLWGANRGMPGWSRWHEGTNEVFPVSSSGLQPPGCLTYSSQSLKERTQVKRKWKNEKSYWIFEFLVILHTIQKVKFLSKNWVLTKTKHFHEFLTQLF